jgi:hypothetical protein
MASTTPRDDTHIHNHHLNLADDQHSVLARLSHIHVTVGNIDSLSPAAVHSLISTYIFLQYSSTNILILQAICSHTDRPIYY